MELIERRGHLARLVKIELIRSVGWIREQRVAVGTLVFLAEPREKVHGHATVRGIRPCPPSERWGDHLQIGEFIPWPCRVGDLKITSESKPIGVTPNHPFWSPDRNEWVPAGRLEPGERVKTWDGTAAVEWYVMRERPEEAVYNIEVEGDHVYRVGESGVLVHNSSAGNPAPCGTRHPNQTCTDARLDELQAEKDRICNSIPGTSCSPGKVSPKRLSRRPCSEIRTRLQALRECYRIRKQIQDECFGGMPDPAHQNALQETQNGIDACEELEKVNCAPGHPMANK